MRSSIALGLLAESGGLGRPHRTSVESVSVSPNQRRSGMDAFDKSSSGWTAEGRPIHSAPREWFREPGRSRPTP